MQAYRHASPGKPALYAFHQPVHAKTLRIAERLAPGDCLAALVVAHRRALRVERVPPCVVNNVLSTLVHSPEIDAMYEAPSDSLGVIIHCAPSSAKAPREVLADFSRRGTNGSDTAKAPTCCRFAPRDASTPTPAWRTTRGASTP